MNPTRERDKSRNIKIEEIIKNTQEGRYIYYYPGQQTHMFIFTQSCAYRKIIYDTFRLPSGTRSDPPAHFVALRTAGSSSSSGRGI